MRSKIYPITNQNSQETKTHGRKLSFPLLCISLEIKFSKEFNFFPFFHPSIAD